MTVTQTINSWAEIWSEGIWRASWQAGLLILVAVAIARWRAHVSSRVMCWIWRLVSIKTLIAFFWVSPLLIPILPAHPFETIAERPASRVPIAGYQASQGQTDRPAATNQVSQADKPAPTIPWKSLLMVSWLLGLSTCMAGTLKQWNTICRLRRETSPVDLAEFEATLGEEVERLKLRRLPALRHGPSVSGPMLAGIWSPCIMLPASFLDSFGASERRLILAHELAHLKRRDLTWNWLASIVGWVFFFHPLVWLLKRQWSQEQELACDEMVIQRGEAAVADYARTILRIAAAPRPENTSTALVAAHVVGSYRNLERRIRALGHVRPESRRHLAVAAVLLANVGVLVVVPWQLVASEPSVVPSSQDASADSRTAKDTSKSERDSRPTLYQPHIIIAQHVLLMDNELVTWPQVSTSLSVMRNSGRVHAHFHFTNGVNRSREKGATWQAWNDRIMGMHREPHEEFSLGYLSPPAGERYDAIRTEADLRPDPARARPGQVLTPGGKPAVGAQVIVVPQQYMWGLTLEGTELRDPWNEQVVSTNASGQFTAYPKKDDYRIVCLHPSGFAMQTGMREGAELSLQLQPWGTIRFAPVKEPADQSTVITSTPRLGEPDSLQFQIFSIRSEGKLLEIKVPPGRVAVSRSIQLKEGTGISTPVDTLTLAPGAIKNATIGIVTDADRKGARETYESLERPRKRH
ncbi:MAG TPA: M56 family metallopeptidase [Planctomycetaceae bacterium]|nr:M56 family metallopeptidase [Planctomycetaceae bacterium]